MKKILITGAGSYIGKNIDRYLQEYNSKLGREEYRVDRISQRDSMWETFDMTGYDVVFQASGIAHVDVDKVTDEEKKKYYEVNCDLAVDTARRAAKAGVKQFIYPSSVIIYGDSAPYGLNRVITADTVPSNTGFYGDSKICAEKSLMVLKQELDENRDEIEESDEVEETEEVERSVPLAQKEAKRNVPMAILILRLPMVYGPGSKGNYKVLAKIAGKTPVFPTAENQRSMIYIDNLCECIRQAIDGEKEGIIYPQNREYVSTPQMVQEIARTRGKRVHLVKALNPLVRLMSHMPGKIGKLTNKAFGSLCIDQNLSSDRVEYCIYSFEESVKRSEKYES